ncbi:hypothetical protein [Parabacteroides distasonis]|nr:hypothetical protein [Parabacteroides distasonis]MCR1851910.1 hypothetical protein [Parabacteroides distasonis]
MSVLIGQEGAGNARKSIAKQAREQGLAKNGAINKAYLTLLITENQ